MTMNRHNLYSIKQNNDLIRAYFDGQLQVKARASRFFATILFFIFIQNSPLIAQMDSLVLSYPDFVSNILENHPMAQKANLQLKNAVAERLIAKGNLDPKLAASWQQKNFDKKLYYRQYQGAIKIPTPLGIDFVGGYENTEGVFLNPENTTDEFGLWHVGVEANILQGLIVNERRTALQQAEVFAKMAVNEQQIMLNDLLYEASIQYLEWQKYEAFASVIEENLDLAATYFINTRESFLGGEKTAMDTLEAYILQQDVTILYTKNQAALIKIRQMVENYLWLDEAPVGLQATTRPEPLEDLNFSLPDNINVASMIANHPSILAYQNKQVFLEIEQRWKREKLKPKLKIKYHPLLATNDENITPNFSDTNYKWGFDFSMPLLFRSERGNIQRGEVKILETNLDLQNKRNELQNKLENTLLQRAILQEQLDLLRQNIVGYRALLEGENEKFRFGESSVFLVNKRQEKYLDSQIKLIELLNKLQLESLNILYYTASFF